MPVVSETTIVRLMSALGTTTSWAAPKRSVTPWVSYFIEGMASLF